VPEPVSVMVDSKRTGKVSDEKLTGLVRKHFDLTPKGLIEHLKLRRPIYRQTAATAISGAWSPASPGSAPTRRACSRAACRGS